MTAMLSFLIKVPGHTTYQGIFATAAQAQGDAARRFPDAHPATVLCASRLDAEEAQ